MSDEDEQPTDPIAAMDQLLRGMVDMAKSFRGYYLALIATGFTEQQAFGLTVAFQSAVIQAGRGE